MPLILRDETAAVDVLYFDNAGQVGIMGSANAGQALSFAGVGVISNDAWISAGAAPAGSSSPLAGTIVIPISGSSGVFYGVPQPPSVTSPTAPATVTTTETTWNNSSTTSTLTVPYNIW
jgi:hypothetical protein